MTQDVALVLIWAGFLAVSCGGAIALFLWAIRSGQFGDQERARSLALEAEVPASSDKTGRT